MNTSDTRVEDYLDDLARMLADLDPGYRDEVLGGIREHLDATLAEHPDDPSAVDAALLRLGPPEQVAAEARRGAPPMPVPVAGPPKQSARPASGTVARVAVVTTLLATVPLLAVGLWSRALSGGGLVPMSSEVLVLAPLAAPLWAVGLVCTLVAPRLTGRTRLRLALSGPLAFGATVTTALWWSPERLSSLVSVLLLLGAGAVALTAGRAAWREARD